MSPVSLGGPTLRQAVLAAARSDYARTPDLKGIVWLEHINLVVGWGALAELFYQEFLGLTQDTMNNFHFNLGQQQFHLAESGSSAQRITGSIGLVVPSLTSVRERIPAAVKALGGNTEFQVMKDSDGCMTVTGPDGNIFHLYDAQDDGLVRSTNKSNQFMTNLHAEGGPYGSHRMSVRGKPGIRYVEVACRPGTAPAIARFYEEMLDCTVSTPATRQAAIVRVGNGIHLIFAEDDRLTEDDVKRMEGMHICVYVSDFEGLYNRLKERGLVWTNPRFSRLDTCDTWDEAVASRTLRFKDIIDLSTGEKVLELEHETRPLSHGQYLKVPFYEEK